MFCVLSCYAKSDSAQAITDDVSYSAKDSIVMIGTKVAELYGDAEVHYQNIELKAAYIRLRLDSSTVYACGVPDSTGALTGKPKFKDGREEYESKEMHYNFKTRKGVIKGTVTQQGEGYLTADRTKKVSDDEYCLKGGKYTTCDEHEHPHYYLALTKAKMKQGKYIVSGPAYMVLEDVPLPLAIPFGYFPINNKYSSGILFPTLGEEAQRGFFAKGMGYYFAINDYVDLAITADIYTKGSWNITAASSYKWRYKFSGRFNLSFLQTVTGEKYTPDYAKSNDFKIMWSHTQDQKMNPSTQFSASVDFSTSSYERNNVDSYYNPNLISQNTKNSTVSLTQSFPGTPLSLTATLSATQRTSDSTLNLVLPQVTFRVSRVYPFKRKKAVGKEKWYEKINFTYNLDMSNSVTCKEKDFTHTNFLRDWKNGVKHELPISTTFTIAKYLNLSVNFNNTLKWYFTRVDQHWEGDWQNGKAVADTTTGFYNVYNCSASIGLSTQLYGFFTPKVKKGKNAPVFRHKFAPSVSLSAAPDFGHQLWGYWSSYERPLENGGTSTVYYDRFSNGIYGGSQSRGAQGAISFTVANSLEMKYWSKNDTTGKAKKVTLIDNFSFGSSYNFIADSLRWSDINMNLRLRFWDKFSMSIDFVLDPYTYQLNEYGAITKVNVSQVQKNHVLGRLKSTGTSFGYTFNNQTFKKKKDGDKQPAQQQDKNKLDRPESELLSDMESVDPMLTPIERQSKRERWKSEDEVYQEFKIPWSLNLSYSIRYAYNDFNYDIMEYNRKLTHNLSISGSIDFTKTWHFTMSTYYDITNNKWSYMNCTISKDLHCWQMSCSFVPIGTYTTYNFMIGVKSTLLQDLKYTKQSDTSDRINWY